MESLFGRSMNLAEIVCEPPFLFVCFLFAFLLPVDWA